MSVLAEWFPPLLLKCPSSSGQDRPAETVRRVQHGRCIAVGGVMVHGYSGFMFRGLYLG